VPSDLFFKTMNTVHRGLIVVTGGRKGWHVSDMPVLRLTTTGRRTGRRRRVMLTSPLRDGGALVVVASRGGDDKAPAWLLNLEADPEVEVARRGGRRERMRARVATAEERDRLWPQIVADHPRYGEYQAKTGREISLVLLTPQSPHPPATGSGRPARRR
jgi:deazaflavin-dependent oxidoreductase (nitroreductase family)